MHFRHPVRTAVCGAIGSFTEGVSGGDRMRLPRSVQRFVAPKGAPPKAPYAVFACVSPARYNSS
eukprot:8646055-Pyramimonas_sp.AAC.1